MLLFIYVASHHLQPPQFSHRGDGVCQHCLKYVSLSSRALIREFLRCFFESPASQTNLSFKWQILPRNRIVNEHLDKNKYLPAKNPESIREFEEASTSKLSPALLPLRCLRPSSHFFVGDVNAADGHQERKTVYKRTSSLPFLSPLLLVASAEWVRFFFSQRTALLPPFIVALTVSLSSRRRSDIVHLPLPWS